jgi:hypothetical protein
MFRYTILTIFVLFGISEVQAASWGQLVTVDSNDVWYQTTGGAPGFLVVETGSGRIGNEGTPIWTGYRFTNVTIPQGTTIDSVVNLIYSTATNNDVGQCNVVLYCEDTNSGTQFSTYTDFEARLLTTAKASWSSIPSLTVSTRYRFGGTTGDIKAPIQEVISRAGWVSGNNLVLIIKDSSSAAGTGNRKIGHVGASAPNTDSLVIYYTAAGGGSPTSSTNRHDPAGIFQRHSTTSVGMRTKP